MGNQVQSPRCRWRQAVRRSLPLALLGVGLVLPAACRKPSQTVPESAPRTEDMSWGHVQIQVTAQPPKVEYDRDILLTIQVTAPREIDVKLPELADRFKGFLVSGSFDEGPHASGDKTTFLRHLSLTPVLAEEHRLAPFAVHYTDRSRTPPTEGWFPTRPMVFETVPPVAGDPGKEIHVNLVPVWIHPPFRTVALYALAFLGAVGLLFGLWWLLRRIHRQIRLLRMSPRERALEELAALLAKDLVARDRVKDFYLELTMIVRRYIERAHSVRAPEQTTEEFLQAAAGDARFSAATVEKLRAFLQAADLVKFAAYRPAPDKVLAATGTARDYIESDTADVQAGSAAKGP